VVRAHLLMAEKTNISCVDSTFGQQHIEMKMHVALTTQKPASAFRRCAPMMTLLGNPEIVR